MPEVCVTGKQYTCSCQLRSVLFWQLRLNLCIPDSRRHRHSGSYLPASCWFLPTMAGLYVSSKCSVLQVMSDSRPFVQEEVWTAHDFPTGIDNEFAITNAQYQSLKQNWIGTPVKPRDPRVTDKLLRPWGMNSWKQYVLDRYLTNY